MAHPALENFKRLQEITIARAKIRHFHSTHSFFISKDPPPKFNKFQIGPPTTQYIIQDCPECQNIYEVTCPFRVIDNNLYKKPSTERTAPIRYTFLNFNKFYELCK